MHSTRNIRSRHSTGQALNCQVLQVQSFNKCAIKKPMLNELSIGFKALPVSVINTKAGDVAIYSSAPDIKSAFNASAKAFSASSADTVTSTSGPAARLRARS